MQRLLLLSLLCCMPAGCGGAQDSRINDSLDSGDDPAYSSDDFVTRPVLARAELTTAVNELRMRPAAAVSTEFDPGDPVIHLIARMKRLPANSLIEVRWFRDVDPEPILVSEDYGAGTYTFIASLSPPDREFKPGSYTVRVFVNGTGAGAVPFRILGDDTSITTTHLRGIAISTRVDRKNRPRNKGSIFNRGTKRLYASFAVENTTSQTMVTVRWTRNEELFHEQDLPVSRDRRVSAYIHSSDGLPSGSYVLEVAVDNAVRARKPFRIGDSNGGPCIDEIRLGTDFGENNMPVNNMESFSADTGRICCGIVFLDLDPGSAIEVQWIYVDGEEELVMYKTRSGVPSGGSGTMGAVYEPAEGLYEGEYRAVILINGEVAADAAFIVK